MPWFPEFISAAELARNLTRAGGLADPVSAYLTALDSGHSRELETVWPGEVVIFDPRAGEVRGHHRLRQFVRQNHAWLDEHQARIETVASTRQGSRAVVELLAHVTRDGHDVGWPMAVVADALDDRAVVFRTYCSQWPVDGRRHLRPPILEAGEARSTDVVDRYQLALAAGDVDGVVGTFGPDGCLTEPIGPDRVHRGAQELRTFYAACFSAGGGIAQQPCVVTDDGIRCAVEYNCIRWGRHDVPPQAGVAVHERGADGRLSAVRYYDDIEAPVEQHL